MNKILFCWFLSIFLSCCVDKSQNNIIDSNHIKLDNDTYLKPLGKNTEGCSTFSPYSVSGKVVISVIYFLDINEKPTTDSNPENCK